MMATAAPAEIGHNNPPEPTPLEAFKAFVDDLYTEAVNFLDGDPIATEGQAEAVSKLLDDARKAEKDGEAKRKEMTKPLDEAKAAIMDEWRPLVDPKTGRCKLIADTCKKALAPWLQAKDDEMRAAAEAARLEAEEKAAAARALHQAAEATDLAAQEAAEQALKEADAAAKAADRADKAKAHVGGGSRAVGLRSVWTATIVDRRAALNHYIVAHPQEFVAIIQSLADSEARHGPRTAPGIQFTEDKVAV